MLNLVGEKMPISKKCGEISILCTEQQPQSTYDSIEFFCWIKIQAHPLQIANNDFDDRMKPR
jgi:hypothetical protein